MSRPIERKLTTIFAADAEGYSREMGRDELGTLDALRGARDVFFRLIEDRGGRVANTAGDGLIAEFPSVVEAMNCAVEVQRELGASPETYPLRFRIGLHLGDVIVDGTDLLGEGVNLAARLQSMAEPGGILLSQQVYDQVRTKLTVGFEFLGEQRPRNCPEDVSVYRVTPSISDPSPSKPIPEPRAARTPLEEDRAETTGQPVEEAISSALSHVGRFLDLPLGKMAKPLAITFGVLLLIDLLTGSPFFVHWLTIPVFVVVGYRRAPSFSSERFPTSILRAGIILSGLLLLNFFSWSGSAWVVYPTAAYAAVFTFKRLRGKSN